MAEEGGPIRATPVVSARALNCPNCGATVTVRSFGNAVNVVCSSCHSILDAQNPQVQVLQQFQAKIKYTVLIPLGSRGKLRGTLYEVIGYQVRQIQVEGEAYSWREYLLFNPYKGFVYLTEYDGHWNYVTTLKSLPQTGYGRVNYLGENYRHFQTATAETIYVLGEFPWQVRVGEKVEVSDFVSPPRVISSEITSDKEVNWSLGEYITGADLWKTFSVPGQPPAAVGVYENQPSPLGELPKKIWKYCGLLLLAAILLFILHVGSSSQQVAFQHAYVFDPAGPGDKSFLTEAFELEGRTSAVKVETAANPPTWIYLNYVLVNEDTHQNFPFSREVTFRDDVSEGTRHDSVVLPSIPPGRYHFRIAPEGDVETGKVDYQVTVKRGVPVGGWFVLAAVLLVVPAIFLSWRRMNFEHLRWQESDQSSGSSVASSSSSGGFFAAVISSASSSSDDDDFSSSDDDSSSSSSSSSSSEDSSSSSSDDNSSSSSSDDSSSSSDDSSSDSGGSDDS